MAEYRELGVDNIYPPRERLAEMVATNPDVRDFYVSVTFLECQTCGAFVPGHARNLHSAWHLAHDR